MKEIPPLFWERLRQIIPPENLDTVRQAFCAPRPVSVRVNTLKISLPAATAQLREKGVSFRFSPAIPEALVIDNVEGLARCEDFFNQGLLYRQSLSSLLPVKVLAPNPGENVLDMCAAPGSKTTQMAAAMNNQGTIVALEAIRGRFYKLKAVLALLGANNVTCHVTDARRYKTTEGFDKILLDAPCSSEGRFSTLEPKTFAFWSPRKIKEMVRKQRRLLLQALRLVKPGGIVVYSTCTFSPEENEGVVDWVLRKTKFPVTVQPIALPAVSTYPAIQEWQEKRFDPRVAACFRVLPDEQGEGFFMVKIVRIA